MDFECPRCGAATTDEFYGPCSSCRTVLRAAGGPARTVDVEAYEPKMNVTPNSVATKD
jgi:predicted anti-sigma-YlaC factor YlaD